MEKNLLIIICIILYNRNSCKLNLMLRHNIFLDEMKILWLIDVLTTGYDYFGYSYKYQTALEYVWIGLTFEFSISYQLK